jgi:sugar O-acyltransferase (sialic acid O-acetyltransferase NeuD family)
MSNILQPMPSACANPLSTQSPRTLVVVGASGHGKVVAEAASAAGFSVIGHLDDVAPTGELVNGRPRLGNCSALPALVAANAGLAVALGIGDNAGRLTVARQLVALLPDIDFPAIVHPAASVASSAHLGCGVVVLAQAVVNLEATLGDFALVNTGAIVEHDCRLGRSASLAPAAVMGGNSTLGEGAALMMGALLRHRAMVGDHTIVGMGSVVVSDLPPLVVAWGNPARTRHARTAGDAYF